MVRKWLERKVILGKSFVFQLFPGPTLQLCLPRSLRSDITIFSALGFMGMACAKLLVGPRLDKQKLI